MNVLFVCMFNICRSPALEAALRVESARRHLSIKIDSCGVGWVRLGESPDEWMVEAARKRSIALDHSVQQFQERFLDEFDLVLAVDCAVLERLKLYVHDKARLEKLHLATVFSKKFHDQEIPDPYYLGPNGFDYVMDMAEDIAEGLISYFSEERHL